MVEISDTLQRVQSLRIQDTFGRPQCSRWKQCYGLDRFGWSTWWWCRKRNTRLHLQLNTFFLYRELHLVERFVGSVVRHS